MNMKFLLITILLTVSTFHTDDVEWLSKSGQKKLETSISKIWKNKTILKIYDGLDWKPGNVKKDIKNLLAIY